MKKIISIFLLTFVIFSCQKEDITNEKQNKNSFLSVSSYNVGFDQRGWLVFDDYQHLRDVVENLNQQDDEYYLQFEEELSQITEETSYEDEQQIIEESGIVDQAVYKGFESDFNGYTSLRHVYNQAEEEWLQQQTGESIDFSTLPEHYISAPGLSSVFNEYGEIQIGNIVYMTKEDGRQIGIYTSELDEVEINELRNIFHSDTYDIVDADYVEVTDEDTVNQFLYGGQKLYNGDSKGGGVVFYVGIPVGAITVQGLYDAVRWLNEGDNQGDCYYDKNEYKSWKNDNGDRKLRAVLKYQQILAYGQNSHIKLRSYRKFFGEWVWKVANLRVIEDVPHILPNINGSLVCFDGYDAIKSDSDDRNYFRVVESKWIAPYHEALIHPGYMRGRYYKNGSQRLDFYIF
ncbi:MAG: hypothetical protein ACOCPM_06310 [Bacteroidales bacterium]